MFINIWPYFNFFKTWLNWTLVHSDLTHFWYKTMSVTYCLNLPLARITWIYDIVQCTDKDINTSLSATDSGNDWISSTISIGTSLRSQFAKHFWKTSCTMDTTWHYTWYAICSTFQLGCRKCVCWFHVTKMHKANSLCMFDTRDALVKWLSGHIFSLQPNLMGKGLKHHPFSGNTFSSKETSHSSSYTCIPATWF
jgi:hypothetical protein